MAQKMIKAIAVFAAVCCLSSLGAGYYLDEHGYLKGFVQENGQNGYMILDKDGHAEAYIQENGDNGYMILDSEGKAQGYYQED
jgi:hypothetical protein